MRRPEGWLVYLFVVTLIANDVTARPITSNDMDDDNTLYMIDELGDDYDDWNDFVTWRVGETWARPWRSGMYRSQSGGLHRNLNHEYSSATIEFEGELLLCPELDDPLPQEDATMWLYRPQRRRLSTIPVEYEFCLDEDEMGLEALCYRMNTAEAYLIDNYYDTPAMRFTRGGLRYRRIVEYTDELDDDQSTESSHTTEQSTPPPIPPPTRPQPQPDQPPTSIRPSKSLPLNPPPRSAQRLRPGMRRPIYRRPSRSPKFGTFAAWCYIGFFVFWGLIYLWTKYISMRSRKRERERLLKSIQAPRREGYTRLRNVTAAAVPPPLDVTPPLMYHTPPDTISPLSVTSNTSTIPPSYADVIREQEESFE